LALCALAVWCCIGFAECLITSGTIFTAPTVVDRTCLGDVIAFDGNFFIAGRDSRIAFNVGLPVFAQALLLFQGDGERKTRKLPIFFCCAV